MAADPAPLAAPAALCGWLGQACFFARFLLQWIASERARRSVVPRAFWWLSLCGAALTSAYVIRRREPVLLAGLLVGGAIAARNLALQRRGGRRALDARWLAGAAALFLGVLLVAESREAPFSLAEPLPWLLVATIGQALWVSRFPLQWWHSERRGVSRFPASFWWASLAGNLLLLAYALHLRDPVFVLGFLPGPFVQARNLLLSARSALARADQ